jgi:hypothetical protein
MIRSSDSLAPLSPRAKDLVVRFHYGSSWPEKLFGRTAHDLAILDELASAPEPLMVAAVASFHWNGYVREAAVDWLDTLGEAATTSFASHVTIRTRLSAWRRSLTPSRPWTTPNWRAW